MPLATGNHRNLKITCLFTGVPEGIFIYLAKIWSAIRGFCCLYLVIISVVIAVALCSVPIMCGGFIFPVQYEIKYMHLLESNGYYFGIIFSLGASLPVVLNSGILAMVHGMNRIMYMLILSALVFVPEAVLVLGKWFPLENIIMVDCILRIRAIVVLGIIAYQIERLQQESLVNVKSIVFAMLCGGCSLVFNCFACYELANSEIYFIFYLVCSIIGVLNLALLAFRLYQSHENSFTTQSTVANRLSLFYIAGTCLVSMVYVIVSLIWRYQDSAGSAEWYVSLAMFIRTSTVVVVFLLEWQSMQCEELSKRVVEECGNIEKTFVRLISHELRSPLNAIDIGLNSILEEMTSRECSEDAMEALEQVRSSCNFVTSILNDLLSEELLEKGIMRLTKTHLPAFSLLLDLVTPSFFTAQKEGVLLNLSPRRDLMAIELKDVTLHGDKAKLIQMMNNLLMHAIKAAPKGYTVSVMATTITKSARDRSSMKKSRSLQEFLKLCVFCPGKGVNLEEIEKMFADDKGRRRASDNDSDLWVCKSIVDLHNGEISVATQKRIEGFTFTVILPVMPSETDTTSRKLLRRSSVGECKSREVVEESKVREAKDRDRTQGETPVEATTRRTPSSSSLRRSNLGPLSDPPVNGSPGAALRRNTGTGSMCKQSGSDLVMPFDAPVEESTTGVKLFKNSILRLSASAGGVGQELNKTFQSSVRRKPSTSLSSSYLVMPFDSPTDESPALTRQRSDSNPRLSVTSSIVEQHVERVTEVLRRRNPSSSFKKSTLIPVDFPAEESKGDRHAQGQQDKASSQFNVSEAQPVKMSLELSGPSALPAKTEMRYGSTVLCVDDSVINLKMMTRLVAKRCDTVLEAKDGVEAVAAVQASMKSEVPVDLVLMDFQMPNMDGPTAASAMRKMGYTGPIIGVTGNVMTVDKELFISKGADRVLFKPVNANQIDFTLKGLQISRRS